ncbi:hypothetical protein [Streptomyces chilikensis]|uniref:Uncharacterized protein n=1 Tax=Streptomyces chilikensis TaxID=1194079 RepID=A0ABV3ERI7_9ACTN
MTATVAPVALEDTELGGVLTDLESLRGQFPAIGALCDAIRAIATDDTLNADATATLLTVIASNSGQPDVLSAFAHLIGHLSNADTNPAVRALPAHQQKDAQHAGETAIYHLSDPSAADAVAEACAAITGCD